MPGPARGTRRTSGRSRTTCGRSAGSCRRVTGAAVVVLARTSEPPCFSVMAMPHVAPVFSPAGRSAGSYSADDQPRLPLGRDVRRVAQGGHGRVGHRDRADVAAVDLVPGDDLGGPGHVGAGPVVGPGTGVEAVRDRGGHQPVVVGVVVDDVDAVAVPVVGAQLRRVAVGPPAPLDGLGRPGQPAEGPAGRRPPSRRPSRPTASARATSVAKTSWPSSGGGWLLTSWVSKEVAMPPAYGPENRCGSRSAPDRYRQGFSFGGRQMAPTCSSAARIVSTT